MYYRTYFYEHLRILIVSCRKVTTTHFLHLSIAILVSVSGGYSQTNDNLPDSPDAKKTWTGIVLVSDWRCEERSPKLQRACPASPSEWGLLTGADVYLLQGDPTNLKKYERTRVTITGTVKGKSIAVDSIVQSQLTQEEIRALIEHLKFQQWTGPENYTNPSHWIFNFTDPMLRILQAGPAAQDSLLQYLGESDIKDQIIILLGGVGDEKAVEAIIRAMPDAEETRSGAGAKRINLVANLALTNITVSDVIWHHGGGISIDACPEAPKSCWYAWWIRNRDNFRASTSTTNRNYSNYPNYGIYRQP